MKDLDALRAADLAWVRHLDSVWQDYAYDVTGLHGKIRREFEEKIHRYAAAEDRFSPLGWVIEGAAGTGKTHLAGWFRKVSTDLGANFVLVDMTDIHDFWETVLQGYWSSLQQPFGGGKLQSELVLESLLRSCGVKKSKVRKISDLTAEKRELITVQVLTKLIQEFPQEGQSHQDVVRALILLNSNDLAQKNVGFSWLQGLAIEDADKAAYKFLKGQAKTMEIVRGLSWVMSLRGLTVLVFDQIDAIVNQHHLQAMGAESEAASEAQRASKAIIEGLAGGLLAIHDLTSKTLSIVSCLRDTWEILKKEALEAATDRFELPRQLERIGDAALARQMIAGRLAPANEQVGHKPPYPTYPFAEAFFEEAASLSPRELLKRCEDHRRECLRQDKVVEISHLGPPIQATPPGVGQFRDLEADFQRLREMVDLTALTEEENEDGLLEGLLQTAGACLIRENDLPPDVDAVLDIDFPGGRVKALHARIRLIFRNQSDREEHCCLRSIERRHPVAFQARLKAAITGAGIDRSLKFRRLIVVRRAGPPAGAKTGVLLEAFRGSGGILVRPEDGELRTLWALHELNKERRPELNDWLRETKPASKLAMLAPAVAMFRLAAPSNGDPAGAGPDSDWTFDIPGSRPTAEPGAAAEAAAADIDGRLLVGYDAENGRGETVTLPPDALLGHTVILGGSGYGKTVLVKRLVEEAAVLGIPSIVVDPANDLAGLGDKRTVPPEGWTPLEAARAERFWAKAEVVVWTPGRQVGNPLFLDPMPDLAELAGDEDALGQGVDMVRESLEDILAGGGPEAVLQKRGVLTAALRYFALRGGGGLKDLIALLADLPEEAGAGIGGAAKIGSVMANGLRARIEIDPLLRREGKRLDPGVLFGLKPQGSRTRVSVINLAGIGGTTSQCLFLSQLAMILFAWIRKHPATPQKPVTGLLVLDEAKDFVPAVGSTACSAGLIRLASQARKYGLGLILASQAPKSIDNRIMGNASTQIFGRLNAPASIDAAVEMLRRWGGDGGDIARLPKGTFYLAAGEGRVPRKIAVPLCVSDHGTLTEDQVTARAARSRPA